MSWKMFWQIVLLILIACVLGLATKCAMFKCPIMGKLYRSWSCPQMQMPAK